MPESKPLPHEILKFIPKFDGAPFKLANFISILDEIFNEYCSDEITEHASNHWLLLRSAICRLEGPAEAAAFNNNVNCVSSLKHVLVKNFADNRTIPDLLAEIATMKSFHREHPIEFLNRLDEKRTHVVTKYRLDGLTQPVLGILTEQLNTTIIRTLVHGVHPQLGAHLQVLGPKDLDEARSMLINNCNIVLQQLRFGTSIDLINKFDFKRYSPAPNFHKNPNLIRPIRNNYQSNFSPQNTQNFRPQYTPRFPSNHPNNPEHPFNRSRQNFDRGENQKWNSQNTVSMRTVNSRKQFDHKKYLSPYELNHVSESVNPHMEENARLQSQIQDLSNTVSKLSDTLHHFLEVGPTSHESPPNLN